jgi:hypothetical protein
MSDIVTPKAVITQVSVGSKSIEGLMSEDGTFGIAIPQLVSHDLVAQKNASRELIALLGNGFKFLKWRTTLNRKAVNVILLPDFERLLLELALSGNRSAIAMARDLAGLALTQLFADAFGQKFEKQDRQAWLIDRQSHREDFHPYFTSWLKLDGCEGVQYAIEVNNFKQKLGLPIAPVDTYDAKQLRTLDKGYIKYDTLRTTGMSHTGALLSL